MKFELLLVGIGGFGGSVCRYLVYFWMGRRNMNSFPWATLLVNLMGCFLIGFAAAMMERSATSYRNLYLLGTVGFLGAFTTFSAFGFETFNLLRNQHPSLALINVFANVICGLVAVWAGRSLTLL